jgi:hypothetical protein
MRTGKVVSFPFARRFSPKDYEAMGEAYEVEDMLMVCENDISPTYLNSSGKVISLLIIY